MYKYKVTYFDAKVLETDTGMGEKICTQLEDQLEQYANDGWEFTGQYTFEYDIEETEKGCFGSSTGKGSGKILKTGRLRQLVFRKEI